jgi:hypothetical protein
MRKSRGDYLQDVVQKYLHCVVLYKSVIKYQKETVILCVVKLEVYGVVV